MNRASKLERFAWGVLLYNILVILFGALVRATGAGAGCGSHWPLCNGAVVPPDPGLKTIIEFTHRLTSGLALIGVVGLWWGAFRAYPRGDRVRRYAVLAVVFILVEALLGAGLVLLEYVDQNKSVGRAVYLSAHLVNTQILLAMLVLTAWYIRRPNAAGMSWNVGAAALAVSIIVGISGAVAALGDTLFPATSFSEGVRQEMSTAAHFLLRLRILHPILAILGAVTFILAGFKALRAKPSADAVTFAWWVWGLTLVQLIAGAINVLLLAPIWMQLFHLLLADLLWIYLVLLAVESSATARSAPS